VLTSVTIAIFAPGPIGFIGAGLFAQHSTVASRLLIAGSATLGAVIIALSPATMAATTVTPAADGGVRLGAAEGVTRAAGEGELGRAHEVTPGKIPL
jgi:hypothetical protein